MNWTTLVIIAVVVAIFLARARAGQISAKDASAYLKNGALVIDVRTSGEFNSGHLAGAVNLPLDGIEAAVAQRVKDKSQVLLLHCASGVRSGLAQKKLIALGYPNTFNLGSYRRAEGILRSAR